MIFWNSVELGTGQRRRRDVIYGEEDEVHGSVGDLPDHGKRMPRSGQLEPVPLGLAGRIRPAGSRKVAARSHRGRRRGEGGDSSAHSTTAMYCISAYLVNQSNNQSINQSTWILSQRNVRQMSINVGLYEEN